AFDTVHGGNNDVFVTKLDATGSGLLYSTFLGAGGFDYGYEIAIDEAGIALITGATGSPLFPTTPGAFDTTSNGSSDAFVIRLNATGSEVLYGTFLGGTGYEAGHGLAIDGAGNALVTGETSSPLFPTTPDAFDTTFSGDNDIFVVRLVPVDAIIANFTADPLSGVVPLEVMFSNHSAGAYDTCLWDFGDGNSSDSCLDPVHTY